MNSTELMHQEMSKMTDAEIETMKQIYNDITIFPTWLDFLQFIAMVWVALVAFYIIGRAIHYKRRCKRLERQIARMERDWNA